MVSLILVIAAIVCAFLAAFGIPGGRVHLGWLAVALWLTSTVIRA